MALPIAVQVYSVRDNAAADLRATLQAIKDMGYDGVEFAGLYGNKPADIKAMCAEIGLTPISAHVPYLDMVQDPEGVLGTYAEIGCRSVKSACNLHIIFRMPATCRSDKRDWRYRNAFIDNRNAEFPADILTGLDQFTGIPKKFCVNILTHNI
jgi:sugar phosphate isomerase/epimerase